MPAPKRVLCIMDLTVVGRASLSAAVPVLSACGVQPCGLPSALYSTHTGGFTDIAVEDTAVFGERALSHYEQEGIHFDAIYIGYLSSKAQFAFARHALDAYPASFKVVDPALGDGGKLYSGLEPSLIGQMAGLCAKADLITPNITECNLLTGNAGEEIPVEALIRQLAGENTSVLATSVPEGDGKKMVGYVPENAQYFNLPVNQLPQSYPGTGDLFTSAVIGLHLKGLPLEDAAGKAAAFVEQAVRCTLEGEGEVRQGVWFEPCLRMLLQ